MPYCSRLSDPACGCFQPISPPTAEFDSATAALRIFHTKVLECKLLVIPAQRATPPFSPDSTAAHQPTCLTSIVLPLPLAPTTAPSSTSRPIGPVQLQYMIAPQESGKDAHVYPTRTDLYYWTQQHLSHCYQAEEELLYVILFLIKLNWLDNEDLGVLSTIHPDFEAMAISTPKLLQVNFASLRDSVPDYASHTSITPTRMWLLTACAVHYDLDFGLVNRYLGGKYTAEWSDVNEIISTCEPIVSPEVLSQMERILTTGCPLYFNWEEDATNKRAFVSWRNLSSVAQHGDLVAKTLAKEVRNSHLIPMAQWVCTCSPCGRHVPENIQFKPRKKPRLIWNCSTCMF
jgi:hypothetical protein